MLGAVELCGDDSLGICEKHPPAAITKNSPSRRNSLIMDSGDRSAPKNDASLKLVILPTELQVRRNSVLDWIVTGLRLEGAYRRRYGVPDRSSYAATCFRVNSAMLSPCVEARYQATVHSSADSIASRGFHWSSMRALLASSLRT